LQNVLIFTDNSVAKTANLTENTSNGLNNVLFAMVESLKVEHLFTVPWKR